MSRICPIIGKTHQNGRNVSHSNNKTKKRWDVNLQTKRIYDSETNEWIKVRLSTRALRTITKKGISAVRRELQF